MFEVSHRGILWHAPMDVSCDYRYGTNQACAYGKLGDNHGNASALLSVLSFRFALRSERYAHQVAVCVGEDRSGARQAAYGPGHAERGSARRNRPGIARNPSDPAAPKSTSRRPTKDRLRRTARHGHARRWRPPWLDIAGLRFDQDHGVPRAQRAALYAEGGVIEIPCAIGKILELVGSRGQAQATLPPSAVEPRHRERRPVPIIEIPAEEDLPGLAPVEAELDSAVDVFAHHDRPRFIFVSQASEITPTSSAPSCDAPSACALRERPGVWLAGPAHCAAEDSVMPNGTTGESYSA